MKLYAKIVSLNETQITYERRPSSDQAASPYQRSEGWYEIEREPGEDERLEYDEQNACIVIKKREKSAEQAEAERRVAIKRQLVDELPDIILQNKDNPEALVQALCNRAKEIEVTNDLRTA